MYTECGVTSMDKGQFEKYHKLGLNIAYYRKDKGYTQEQLADALNLDRTTISKIELALSGVSLDVLFRLSDELQVPVYKFFVFPE